MDNKEQYFQALKTNKGILDEVSLGETIGLDQDTTMRIISQLLSEYRIDFETVRNCSYKVKS
jgi:hypothetical protein